MFSYNIYINNGVEAFGTEGKTITVNEVVSRASVSVRAYAECEKKFTDLLMAESSGLQRKDVIEKARVMKTDGTGTITPTPTPGGGDNSGGGGSTGGGGNNDDDGGGQN